MSKTVTVTCTMKVVMMMNRISKVSSSLIAKSWVKTYLYPRDIKPSTRNGMNGSLQLQVERVSRKLSMPLKPVCDASVCDAFLENLKKDCFIQKQCWQLYGL